MDGENAYWVREGRAYCTGYMYCMPTPPPASYCLLYRGKRFKGGGGKERGKRKQKDEVCVGV